MLDPQDLARALQRLRGKRTQKEVSERAGLNPATWSAYERGSRVPRPERLQQVAEGLGISIVELQNAILESANRRVADAMIRDISRTITRAVPSGAGEESAEVQLFIDDRLTAASREIRDLLSFMIRVITDVAFRGWRRDE